jgi:hypothetical protein
VSSVRPLLGNAMLPTRYLTRLDGSRADWLGVIVSATAEEQAAAQLDVSDVLPGSFMVEWRNANERDTQRRWEWPLDLGEITNC